MAATGIIRQCPWPLAWKDTRLPIALNEETRASLPFTALLSLIVSLVTGTVASVAAAYGVRDKMLDEVHLQIVASADTLRQERKSLFLTKEDFSAWREQDRVRQDRQYYNLLNAVERLNERQRR
jgi:hypothetical protein